MVAINRSTTQAHDGQVLVGITNNLKGVTSLPLAGTVYTMAELAALIQSRIDTANAAADARAQWLDGSAKYRALNAKVTAVVRALRQYVINVFGADSPVMAQFGFAPTKKTVLTTEQKLARKEKAAATRLARGTKGKKQKKAIKGAVAVPGVAAAPAPSAQPAAPAPALAPAAPKPAG